MNLIGDIFGKPVHGKSTEDRSLPLPNAKVGIEVEVENFDYAGQIQGWNAKQDGSLRNKGMEFTTNGGMVGAQIRESVETICREAKTRKWDVGYPRAGIHIHLDCTDLNFDEGQLANLIAHYMMIEHAMIRFAEGEKVNSRRDCGYCVPFDLGQADFDTLGPILYNKKITKAAIRAYVDNLSKYQALNLRPLGTLGTIEFRALPTTFDSERIMTWIKLILAIKAAAVRDEKRTPLELMSALGAYNYVTWMLGDMAKVLVPYIDANEMWRAVDNVNYLIAAGGQFRNQVKFSNRISEPSPVLEAKREKIKAMRQAEAPVAKPVKKVQVKKLHQGNIDF